MKYIKLLLFAVIISVIKSDLDGYFTLQTCGNFNGQTASIDGAKNQAFSKDFCRALYTTSGKCCYCKYKKGDQTFYNCVELTLAEYYDIDKTIDNLEDVRGIDIKSLECDSSSYLYGSLLFLLAFLL